jgi:hypothetical protein
VDFVNYQLHGTAREFVAMTVAYAITNPAELCTQDYELLERYNVQWLCCKCERINVSTFTFRSYELELSNIYEPISDLNITLESIPSVFSPLKASSPNSYTGNSTRSRSTRNSPRSYLSSNPYDTPVKKNMRIMSQLPQY